MEAEGALEEIVEVVLEVECKDIIKN